MHDLRSSPRRDSLNLTSQVTPTYSDIQPSQQNSPAVRIALKFKGNHGEDSVSFSSEENSQVSLFENSFPKNSEERENLSQLNDLQYASTPKNDQLSKKRRATSTSSNDAAVPSPSVTRARRQETPVFPSSTPPTIVDDKATRLFLSRNMDLSQVLGIAPDSHQYHGPKSAVPEMTQEDNNNEYCESCSGPGVFICCESCPKAFHFACAEPPVDPDHIPSGEWFCNRCRAARNLNSPYSSNLPFSKLLMEMDSMNPVVFFLPDHLKRRFMDTGTDALSGAFVDTFWRKNPPKVNSDEELSSLKKCHACQRGRGTMVNCDFCSLSWHIDCLELPLVNPPNPTNKWMCPCHVEQYLPKAPRRRYSFSGVGNVQITENSKSTDLCPEKHATQLATNVLERTILEAIAEKKRQRDIDDIRQKSKITKEEGLVWLQGLLKFQESMAMFIKDELDETNKKNNTHANANLQSKNARDINDSANPASSTVAKEIGLLDAALKWKDNAVHDVPKDILDIVPRVMDTMEPLFVRFLAWCKLMEIAKEEKYQLDMKPSDVAVTRKHSENSKRKRKE